MRLLTAFFLLIFCGYSFTQVRISYPKTIRSQGTQTQDFKMSYDFESDSYEKDKSITIKLLSGESFTVMSYAKSTALKLNVTDQLLNGSQTKNSEKSYTFTAGTGPYKDKVVVLEKLNDEEFVRLTINVEVSERITGGLAINNSAITSTSFTMNDTTRDLSFIEGDARFTYLGNNHYQVDDFSGCSVTMEYGEFHRNEVITNNSTNGFWKGTLQTCDFYDYGLGSVGRVYSTLNGNWILLSVGDNSGLFGGMNPIVLQEQHVLPGEDFTFDWAGGSCFEEFVVFDTQGNEVRRILNSLGNTDTETITTLVDDNGVYEIKGVNALGADVCIGWVDVNEEDIPSDPPACGEMELTSSCDGEQQRMNFNIPANDDEDGMRVVASATGDIDFDFGMKDQGDGTFGLPEGLPLLDGVGQEFKYKISVIDKDGQSCSQTLGFKEEAATISGFVEIMYDCWGPRYTGWSDIQFDKGSSCKNELTIDGEVIDVSAPDNLIVVAENSGMRPPEGSGKSVQDINGETIGSITISAILDEYPYVGLQPSNSLYREGDEIEVSGDIHSIMQLEIGAFNTETRQSESIGSAYDEFDWRNQGYRLTTKLSPGEYQLEYFYTDCYYTHFYNEQAFDFFMVENVNPEITINLPSTNEVIIDEQTFSVDFSAYDPGEVTHVVVEYAGESIDLFSPLSGSQSVSFDAVYGQNEITISAYDDFGGSDQKTLSIDVEQKQIETNDPEITIQSTFQDVEYGQYFAIEVEVNDLDNDLKEIMFSYNGEIIVTPYEGGNYFVYDFLAAADEPVVNIEARDEQGNLSYDTYTIGLINDQPVATLVSPTLEEEFDVGTEVTIEVEATDFNGIQGVIVNYGGVIRNIEPNGSDLFEGSVIAATPNQNIMITVIDNEGGSTVINQLLKTKSSVINLPEIVVVSSAQDIEYGQYFTVEIEVEDADDDLQEVSFSYGGQTVTVLYTGYKNINGEFQALSGETVVSITVIDQLNNINNDTYTIGLINDQPNVVILSPTLNQNFEKGTSIEVEIEASDFNGVQEAFVEYNGNVLPLILKEGSNLYTTFIDVADETQEFVVLVTDSEGGKEELQQTLHVNIVSNNDPEILILLPADGEEFIVGSPILVRFHLQNLDNDIVEYAISKTASMVSEDTYETGFIAEYGSQFITVWAEDTQGNKIYKKIEVNVVSDRPQITIVSPTAKQTVGKGDNIEVRVLVEDYDFLQIVTASYGGNEMDLEFIGNNQYQGSFTGGQSGEVLIMAEDSFGTVSLSVVNVEVTELTKPTLTIISPQIGGTVDKGDEVLVEFKVTDTEGDVVSVVALNNGQEIDLSHNGDVYKGTFNASSDEVVTVIIVDVFNNEVRKEVNFIIENMLPIITILTKELDGPISSGTSIPFEFTVSEIVNHVELILNGQSLGHLNDQLLFSQVLDIKGQGDQVLEILVTDEFDEEISTTITLQVVNLDPTIVINSPSFGESFDVEEVFNLDVSSLDPEGGLEKVTATFEGKSYDLLALAGQIELQSISPGLKEIVIEATDELGNKLKKTVFVLITEQEKLLPVVEIIPMLDQSEHDFSIKVTDPENVEVQEVELLFFNLENNETIYYKHVIEEYPYVLDISELTYFPWQSGVVGMQVYVITTDGRVGVSSQEFEIDDLVDGFTAVETDKFNVYPNPTKGIVMVSTNGKSVVEIVNSMGHTIQKIEVLESHVFDLSEFATGVYFVKFGQGKVFKLVKE
jgi:hypothetical protein